MILVQKRIVKKFQEELGLSTQEAKALMDSTVESISDTLLEYGRLELRELGIFEVKERAPRLGRCNPNSSQSETIVVAGGMDVAFRAGKVLRQELTDSYDSEKDGKR